MAFLSSKTTLGGNATFTSGTQNMMHSDAITGTVFSDQGGNLLIDQSFDGTNWDTTTTIAVTGGTGKSFNEPTVAPYVRIRYTNGATPQNTFRLFARTRSSGPKG